MATSVADVLAKRLAAGSSGAVRVSEGGSGAEGGTSAG